MFARVYAWEDIVFCSGSLFFFHLERRLRRLPKCGV